MGKFSDDFFKKIEAKTKVGKDTIMNLANKLQNGNMKDEETIKEVINELSTATGKEVSAEKQEKIIEAIKNDKVPKDLDKYVN